MSSIVQYRTDKPPANRWPKVIISPPGPSACCATMMDRVGDVQQDGRYLFQYRRCVRCGYTVKAAVRAIPDLQLVRSLQDDFRPGCFIRGWE